MLFRSTAIPKHNFVNLSSNPTELAGDRALKDQKQKDILSKKLDAWLQKVKKDATTLTPKH